MIELMYFVFFEADVGPGGAGVGGFVDAVAGSLLAGADVDDFGIRGSDGDRADGGDVLLVEDREPDFTCVGGFPDAAAGSGHVVGGWVAGDAGDAGDASGAVRADEAPAHGGIEAGIDGAASDCWAEAASGAAIIARIASAKRDGRMRI